MSKVSARDRSRGVLIAATVLVLVAAVVGTWLVVGSYDEGQSKSWIEYEAHDDELVVYALVRRCDKVVRAEAEETSERVEVRLRFDPGGVCGAVAVEAGATVELSEPLGVRRVYDGSCLDQGEDESQCLRRVRDQAASR